MAERCEVQVSYCIGVSDPMSVNVDTFGTGKISDSKLVEIINEVFDLRHHKIIKHLNLKRPIYKNLAAYGHFGREGSNYSWENTDKIEVLSEYLK